MKIITLVIGLVVLGRFGAIAQAQDVEPLQMHDAGWIRDAADRLARCAGTYRGAAALMRDGGRATGAAYAESVASGALFASYLLLTSPKAVAANVIDGVEPGVYLDALAWGTKRNFTEMAAAESAEQTRLLRECTRTSALQSAVLRSSSDAPVAAAVQPKS